VTTLPYYQALQLGNDTTNGAPMDLRGKAVFIGLSENLLKTSGTTGHLPSPAFRNTYHSCDSGKNSDPGCLGPTWRDQFSQSHSDDSPTV
jgi:hypothetical protein